MLLRLASRPRGLRSPRGFTLVEIMMSSAVLLIAVMGFYAVFGQSNQLAYAARLNTSARVQLDSALAQTLTETWRSEQSTPPLVLQPTAGWVHYLLPGEAEILVDPANTAPNAPTTNVTLLIDARRDSTAPNPLAPVPIVRGLLERNVTVDTAFANARRVSFRLTYGGPSAPLGLRTAAPVILTVHTFRTRDN